MLFSMAVAISTAYIEPCRFPPPRTHPLRYTKECVMNRRDMLVRTGTAALTLGLGRYAFPFGWMTAADAPKRRVLMYTRSQSYEHDVVKRKKGQLSLAETIVTDLGKNHG